MLPQIPLRKPKGTSNVEILSNNHTNKMETIVNNKLVEVSNMQENQLNNNVN